MLNNFKEFKENDFFFIFLPQIRIPYPIYKPHWIQILIRIWIRLWIYNLSSSGEA
jgi:hypothetical protein